MVVKTPLVVAALIPTEPKSEEANTNPMKRSTEYVPSEKGKPPVKRFRTAAARKQYDHTSTNQVANPLSTLIDQAKTTIQRAEQLNIEMQAVLSNLKVILLAAHQKIPDVPNVLNRVS